MLLKVEAATPTTMAETIRSSLAMQSIEIEVMVTQVSKPSLGTKPLHLEMFESVGGKCRAGLIFLFVQFIVCYLIEASASH